MTGYFNNSGDDYLCSAQRTLLADYYVTLLFIIIITKTAEFALQF